MTSMPAHLLEIAIDAGMVPVQASEVNNFVLTVDLDEDADVPQFLLQKGRPVLTVKDGNEVLETGILLDGAYYRYKVAEEAGVLFDDDDGEEWETKWQREKDEENEKLFASLSPETQEFVRASKENPEDLADQIFDEAVALLGKDLKSSAYHVVSKAPTLRRASEELQSKDAWDLDKTREIESLVWPRLEEHIKTLEEQCIEELVLNLPDWLHQNGNPPVKRTTTGKLAEELGWVCKAGLLDRVKDRHLHGI